MFALRKISFSRKDHQTPSLVGLCRAASRSKTKLLSRARALGLALNSSEKCQMCKLQKYSSELCSSSIAMLATVAQILPVPDSRVESFTYWLSAKNEIENTGRKSVRYDRLRDVHQTWGKTSIYTKLLMIKEMVRYANLMPCFNIFPRSYYRCFLGNR